MGHEIDVTIADLVTDYRALTPSQAVTALTPDRSELAGAFLDLHRRLHDAIIHRVDLARQRVDACSERRALRLPLERIRSLERRLDELGDRLDRAAGSRLDRWNDRLSAIAGKLQTLSPLNVLGRGYTLTRTEVTGLLVRDSSSVSVGDRLLTILAQGEIVSRVEEVHPAK